MASETARYSSPDIENRDSYTNLRRNGSWDRHDSPASRPRQYHSSRSRDRSDSPDDEEHSYWRRRRSTTRSRTRSRDDRSLLSDDRSSYDGYRSGSSPRRGSSPLRRQRRVAFRPIGQPLKNHQRGVSAVKFSPDGSMFASCCKPQLRPQSTYRPTITTALLTVLLLIMSSRRCNPQTLVHLHPHPLAHLRRPPRRPERLDLVP